MYIKSFRCYIYICVLRTLQISNIMYINTERRGVSPNGENIQIIYNNYMYELFKNVRTFKNK